MKKLLLAISLFGLQANAQDIYDKMAVETCECIHLKKLDMDKVSASELKMSMGVCILQSYSLHSSEIKLDIGNDEATEKLGEDIGMKMISHCPDFIIALGSKTDEKSQETYASVSGTLTEIKTEQFVSITVKDDKSRVFNFLLLDYFDTAALFTENQLKKNDKVTVSYTETELYDPKSKEFRYYKIITGLEKK